MTNSKTFFIIGLLLFLPLIATAQSDANIRCDPNAASSTTLCNPFANPTNLFGIDIPGATNFPQLLIRLLFVLTTFLGLIPVIVVIAAGFQMLISQGNTEAIQRAKTAFTWAVYGFIVAILSFVIVSAMATFLGATNLPDPANPQAAENQRIVNPIAEPNFGSFLINRLVKNFLELAGVLAILMLIFNGLRYITAGGDEEQISEAKNALKWISSGIIAILFAYVIISAAAKLAGL